MNPEKAIAKIFRKAVKVGGCLILPKQGTRRYFDTIVARIHGKAKHIGAHRLAFEHYHGFIPAGLEVCHSCDNGYCIAKEHLFLGTHKENMMDRNRKGRAGGAARKLSSEQVAQLRRESASGKSNQELAQQFGCSAATVNRYLKNLHSPFRLTEAA